MAQNKKKLCLLVLLLGISLIVAVSLLVAPLFSKYISHLQKFHQPLISSLKMLGAYYIWVWSKAVYGVVEC